MQDVFDLGAPELDELATPELYGGDRVLREMESVAHLILTPFSRCFQAMLEFHKEIVSTDSYLEMGLDSFTTESVGAFLGHLLESLIHGIDHEFRVATYAHYLSQDVAWEPGTVDQVSLALLWASLLHDSTRKQDSGEEMDHGKTAKAAGRVFFSWLRTRSEYSELVLDDYYEQEALTAVGLHVASGRRPGRYGSGGETWEQCTVITRLLLTADRLDRPRVVSCADNKYLWMFAPGISPERQPDLDASGVWWGPSTIPRPMIHRAWIPSRSFLVNSSPSGSGDKASFQALQRVRSLSTLTDLSSDSDVPDDSDGDDSYPERVRTFISIYSIYTVKSLLRRGGVYF